MMPRKKRITIMIISFILILVVIGVVLGILYLNTDLFKSNQMLFAKYLSQNVDNVDVIGRKIGESDYNNLLKQNKYTSDTQIKVNYTENIGTTSENTENSINDLKIEISEKKDNDSGYSYKDVILKNNDENVAQIEYIQEDNANAIRFTDLFEQYILVENENLKELMGDLGYTEDELASIPEEINLSDGVQIDLGFTEEEKAAIKDKYINIIVSNIAKDRYSKENNKVIQFDGKNIQVNAYTLTLTKEELNNIIIKVLEEIKQDEILLGKIDRIQEILEGYNVTSDINFREQLITEIEEMINVITRNNIGKEEAKIIVFENNQKTIRTAIQSQDYEIILDVLSDQESDYLQTTTRKGDQQEETIIYRKSSKGQSLELESNGNGITEKYSLINNENINESEGSKETIFKYEDLSNRIEATVEQKVDIASNLENKEMLDEENAINLNDLEIEQLKRLLEQVVISVSGKYEEIINNVINIEDIVNMLRNIGWLEEQVNFDAIGVTETERNRYNSKFEILQGEGLKKDNIFRIIDAVKENLVDMEVISDTEFVLKLQRFSKNEEVVDFLEKYIEEKKSNEYNVKVGYDDETGLVNQIAITSVKK